MILIGQNGGQTENDATQKEAALDCDAVAPRIMPILDGVDNGEPAEDGKGDQRPKRKRMYSIAKALLTTVCNKISASPPSNPHAVAYGPRQLAYNLLPF